MIVDFAVTSSHDAAVFDHHAMASESLLASGIMPVTQGRFMMRRLAAHRRGLQVPRRLR